MAKSSIIKIYGVECSRLELDEYLKHGARLTNYDPGKMALFGNNWRDGAIGYVTGPLADELAQKHDAWNFRVWKLRLAGDIDVCQRKPTTDEERQANIAYWMKDAKAALTRYE